MPVRFVIPIMVISIGAVEAFANCGDGPAKRRALINWCGACDSSFESAVDASKKNLGRGADLSITLTGPAAPGTTPTATAKEFFKAVVKIREDQKKWLAEDKTRKSSDYEVDFFVSNHGTQYFNGDKPTGEYGITGDQSKVHESLTSTDLFVFGGLIGSMHIGMKAVFGQCFGGSTIEDLLQGYKQGGGSCGCGLSLSAKNQPSIDLSSRWEEKIAIVSGTTTVSQLQAGWKGLQDQMLGKATIATNRGLSTSEAIIFDFYLHTPEGQKLSQAKDEEQLELTAKKIKDKKTAARPLPAHLNKILYESNAQLEAIARDFLMTNSTPELQEKLKEVSATDVSVFSANARIKSKNAELDAKIEKTADQLNSAQKATDVSMEEKQNLTALFDGLLRERQNSEGDLLSSDKFKDNKVPILKSLLARHELEEAFLKQAPQKLIDQFESLRTCELQQFGPGPEKPSPSSNSAEQMRSGSK